MHDSKFNFSPLAPSSPRCCNSVVSCLSKHFSYLWVFILFFFFHHNLESLKIYDFYATALEDTKSKCESLSEPNDWMGTWGKHMKSPCFKTLHSYQKFNHLPGSFQIGRKDRCWRNLQTLMSRHGKKEFGFMPRTFIIPQDLNMLRQTWHKYSQKNTKWIIKPPASARGTGIRVVNSWSQIPKRKPLIVQR